MFTRRFRSISVVLVAAVLAVTGVAAMTPDATTGTTLAAGGCCLKA